MLLSCSPPSPAVGPLKIDVRPMTTDSKITGGAKQIPANSGVKLLTVTQQARVTVIHVTGDKEPVYKTLYEIAVPADSAPIEVPISTQYGSGQIVVVVVVSSNTIESKLTSPVGCTICIEEGIKCCPPKQ
jgi:hypothetical protein